MRAVPRLIAAALVFSAASGGCTSADRSDLGATNTLTIDYAGDAYLLGPANDDNPKFLVFLPLARWDNYCRTGEHVGLADHCMTVFTSRRGISSSM